MKKIFFIVLTTLLLIGILFTFKNINGPDEIINRDDFHGMENMKFKDPREAGELFFQREYDSIIKQSDEEIEILKSELTNFEKIYSYSGYLEDTLDVFKIEYKIKAKDPEMFNVIEYDEDNSITEAKMSLGKPFMVFQKTGETNKFLGLIYTGEIGNESIIGVEIELIKFLEEKGLKTRESFEGNHSMLEYTLEKGGTFKVLLSQPIKQGVGGVWAIDRWMDNHGSVYFPYIESDLDLKKYYGEIQKETDLNLDRRFLDYKEVAQDFVGNSKYYSLNYFENIELEEFYTLPINKYYGYIMEIKKYEWSENNFIDFDKVEFLTLDDEKRLRELKINLDDLPNGYHINNPSTYPESFIVEKDKNTKFYIIDEGGVNLKEVKELEFIQYTKDNKDGLYEVVEKGFDIIKVSEVYLP